MTEPSLAARIRALEGVMPPGEIARHLETSRTYVRVVLRHRRGGSQSAYDVRYFAKRSREILTARSESLKLAYNAVPKDERMAIRRAVYAAHRDEMVTKKGRDQVNSRASTAVCRRGREILAGQGNGAKS